MKMVIVAFAAAFSSSASSGKELWAGHQVVEGKKKVPIFGDVTTRSETFVLARVSRSGKVIELRQRACQMRFAKTLGAKVSMSPETIRRLPEALIRFFIQGKEARADPWVVAWGTEDIDGDGKPGATVKVDAPICGGTLQVASATTSEAEGRLNGEGIVGRIRVRVQQEILATSNGCLSLADDQTDEQQAGTFAYTRVSADSTCENLLATGWPVRAPALERRD